MMATFSTYDELVSRVARVLNRDDLNSDIPDFIRQAEININKRLKVYWRTRYSYFTVVTQTPDIVLPLGFDGFRSLMAQTVPPRPLRYIEIEAANSAGLLANQRGNPTHFTLFANRLRVLPAPQVDLIIEAVYYYRDDFLDSSNQSNLNLENVPDVLLYGALLQAKPFLFDDARMVVWASLYEEGIDSAIEDDKNYRWGDNVLTMTAEYSGNPSGVRTATG